MLSATADVFFMVRVYSPPNQMLDLRYWIYDIAYKDIGKPIYTQQALISIIQHE